MTAGPVGVPDEPIRGSSWSGFNSDLIDRENCMHVPYSHSHSLFDPVGPGLLDPLANILRTDRRWLPADHVQSDVEYVVDQFQRLILAFVLEHQADEFMLHKVDVKNPRTLAKFPEAPHSFRAHLWPSNQYTRSKKRGLEEGDEVEQLEVELRSQNFTSCSLTPVALRVGVPRS